MYSIKVTKYTNLYAYIYFEFASSSSSNYLFIYYLFDIRSTCCQIFFGPGWIISWFQDSKDFMNGTIFTNNTDWMGCPIDLSAMFYQCYVKCVIVFVFVLFVFCFVCLRCCIVVIDNIRVWLIVICVTVPSTKPIVDQKFGAAINLVFFDGFNDILFIGANAKTLLFVLVIIANIMVILMATTKDCIIVENSIYIWYTFQWIWCMNQKDNEWISAQ